MKKKLDMLCRLCDGLYSIWVWFLKILKPTLVRITLDNRYIELLFQPDSNSENFQDIGTSFAKDLGAYSHSEGSEEGWQHFLRTAEEYVRRES